MTQATSKTETMVWQGDAQTGFLDMIDQTLLPVELLRLECRSVETVWEAIKMLRVRGAPAIGIAAAYGVVIGVQQSGDSPAAAIQQGRTTADYLATSRPTAVNLFWALDRMRQVLDAAESDPPSIGQLQDRLLQEARSIHEEDRAMCHAIGQHGAALLEANSGVLTHCNAGGLATAEYGTALSLFFTAQDQGKPLRVFVDETRPLLQGARLTAWELQQRNIDATLICDSMAAHVMRAGKVQAVVTGADRITANGDAANKIGTYGLAVLARAHNIPFYIAAPSSTFDFALDTGEQIPIEERAAEEITCGMGKQTAPSGIQVYNPAFDVTPAGLIKAIITEKGVIQPVDRETIRKVLAP